VILDMRRISVSLPVKSTAFLPGADNVGSGHSTGMNLQAILQNIERLLRARGLNADVASRMAGRPDAIRNLRRKVKGEQKGGITLRTVSDLAEALGTTATDLMRTDHPEPPPLGMREYLLQQRALIDAQLADLDAVENPQPKRPKRKNR
jgi:hypothetical protein